MFTFSELFCEVPALSFNCGPDFFKTFLFTVCCPLLFFCSALIPFRGDLAADFSLSAIFAAGRRLTSFSDNCSACLCLLADLVFFSLSAPRVVNFLSCLSLLCFFCIFFPCESGFFSELLFLIQVQPNSAILLSCSLSFLRI